MPYITAAQRYGSPRPAAVTQNLANLDKTMGRHTESFATAQVNKAPPGHVKSSNTSPGYHALPPRPPPTASNNYGFQPGPGGFGGAVGWNKFGYGQYGYQQNYAGEESWNTSHTPWQKEEWQGTGYYPQGNFNGGHPSSGYGGQPADYYQGIPAATQAQQAWQQEYFRRYQEYAASFQYASYQPYVQYGPGNSQYRLTQQWQTGGNAPVQAIDPTFGAQLNANAPAFQPQAPLKYGFVKPATKPQQVKQWYGGAFKPEAASTQGPVSNLWSGEIAQRTGPAANTRSSGRSTVSPEAEAKNPRKYLLKRPVPSTEYLKQAKQEAEMLSAPRSLLVVLDLNGTLLHRKGRGGSTFKARPYVSEFLKYLLENHSVMVWSSARPVNVDAMCAKLLNQVEQKQLVGVWTRDDLRLSKHAYSEKVQVYKQLSWVWSSQAIQPQNPRTWDQSNTVLIDDSIEKAASEPYNIVQIDEFEGKEEQMQVDVLGQVVGYLEALRWQKNISAYMRSKPFVFDEKVEFDWTPFVKDKQ